MPALALSNRLRSSPIESSFREPSMRDVSRGKTQFREITSYVENVIQRYTMRSHGSSKHVRRPNFFKRLFYGIDYGKRYSRAARKEQNRAGWLWYLGKRDTALKDIIDSHRSCVIISIKLVIILKKKLFTTVLEFTQIESYSSHHDYPDWPDFLRLPCASQLISSKSCRNPVKEKVTKMPR